MTADTQLTHCIKKTICPTKSKEVLSQVRFLEAELEVFFCRNALWRRVEKERWYKGSC